jgi:GTPase SAR1 family protein
MSTVGIDINEWIYDKPRPKSSTHQSSSTNELKNTSLSSSPGGNSSIHNSNSNTSMSANNPYLYIYQQLENSMSSTAVSAMSKYFGPITFRTWDFAGQREYYTTHQYFISRRAIYLVCWKLSEEEKGIDEIHQWLSNIQTRAPGSPVIIVGTHHDQIAKLKNYKEISNYLQRLIYDRFVRPSAETESTSAYPPIMASIEISSKTGHNVKMLARLIYDVATQMKTPGFKDQLLLEQKVSKIILTLIKVIFIYTFINY